MLMIYFAHAGHDHHEETGTVKAATTPQAESPNYGVYISTAVGLSLLVIGIVLLANSFKKRIAS